MTENSARTTANVLLGVAAAGVAVVVLRNPPLRRAAWRMALAAITGTAPAWLRTELARAWAESGAAPRAPGGALT